MNVQWICNSFGFGKLLKISYMFQKAEGKTIGKCCQLGKALSKLTGGMTDMYLTQSELNTNLRSQIETYRTMLSTKDEQLDTSKDMSKELERAYKKERRLKKFYQITSMVGGAAILLLLVQWSLGLT